MHQIATRRGAALDAFALFVTAAAPFRLTLRRTIAEFAPANAKPPGTPHSNGAGRTGQRSG